MRSTLLLILLVTLSLAHAAPIPKDTRTPAKIELDRLEGTWRVTSYQLGGRELAAGSNMLITFKKGEFAWVNAGGHGGKIARIDPAKNPKEVDYTSTEGPDEGKTLKAIYKLDGDTLTDCFGVAGSDRPREFASTRENGLSLLTYTRVKKESGK
jgi:uncharacterized protein (TIGR03067 family)